MRAAVERSRYRFLRGRPNVAKECEHGGMAQAEDINPRMLSWAREAAGLSVAEAAKKLGLKDSSRASATEKLEALEQGKKPPTAPRLLKASQIYRRPLLLFDLSKPPPRGDRGEDFRATNTPISARDNAALDDLVRDIRVRQQMLRELLEDQDEAISQPYVSSATIEHGPAKVAASIREALGVTEDSQQAAKDPSGLFALCAQRSSGSASSSCSWGMSAHITRMSARTYSAASPSRTRWLRSWSSNNNDAEAARSFTLIHELAYLDRSHGRKRAAARRV